MLERIVDFKNDISLDPWKNLGTGLGSDSQLYVFGNDIYSVMVAVTLVGIVLSLAVLVIMLIVFQNKRDEVKRKIMEKLVILLLVFLIPSLLGIIATVASALVN